MKSGKNSEMKKYRFLQHTADAKFQAFGNTIEEAFCHAALAIVSLMWEGDSIEQKKHVRVKVEGRDLKQLLVNFLEEILYLLDTEMFLLSSVEELSIEKKDGSFLLRALFKGDMYSEVYRIFGSVKAITYNEMEISTDTPVMVQVVVDI